MRLSVSMAALVGLALPLSFVYLGCSSSGNSSGDTCGGGADGGTCVPTGSGATPPYNASCVDLTTPTVSFANDVQPVFASSCALGGAACHGDPTLDVKTTGQEFLGYPSSPDGGTAPAAMILSGIVNVASPEDPSMLIVDPGHPESSYLMHKLDQDQCQYYATCNMSSNSAFKLCGYGMPYLAGILEQPTRDEIRRWIAQGAQNN